MLWGLTDYVPKRLVHLLEINAMVAGESLSLRCPIWKLRSWSRKKYFYFLEKHMCLAFMNCISLGREERAEGRDGDWE